MRARGRGGRRKSTRVSEEIRSWEVLPELRLEKVGRRGVRRAAPAAAASAREGRGSGEASPNEPGQFPPPAAGLHAANSLIFQFRLLSAVAPCVGTERI